MKNENTKNAAPIVNFGVDILMFYDYCKISKNAFAYRVVQFCVPFVILQYITVVIYSANNLQKIKLFFRKLIIQILLNLLTVNYLNLRYTVSSDKATLLIMKISTFNSFMTEAVNI